MYIFAYGDVQGYNDNSGLGPILSHYLRDGSDGAKILVLIINALGDHQMQSYFRSTGSNAGLVCEGEAGMDDVPTTSTIKEIHRKSFEDLGGKYIEQDSKEKACAIRLAPTVFFEVIPRFGLVQKFY